MKRKVLCSLAVSALVLAAPAFAGTVYVPVVDQDGTNGSSHTTEVWVSNSGTADRAFSTLFLAADSDGTKRTAKPQQANVQAGKTSVLNGLSGSGKVGLLEVTSTSRFLIEARLTSAHINANAISYATLPVISSDNALAGGQWAYLVGLERDAAKGDHTGLAVVNLGKTTSQCQIKVVRANGTQVAGTSIVSVPPLSLRYYTDALALLNEPGAKDARAEVSCNQQFFAFASVFKASNSQYLFLVPSSGGASTLTAPGEQPDTNEPGSSGGLVFTKSGLIHTVTQTNQKGIVDIPVPRAMGLRRMIVDVDFIPGPWNRIRTPANHNIIWIHRNVGANEFRSNSVVNVNAFSGKNTIKMNQNVDMPTRTQTVGEQGADLIQGQTYHLRYIYDAQNANVTAVVTHNGNPIVNMRMDGTANNRSLFVEPNKLRAEFGHYNFQAHEGPEVASFGWQYLNLKVELVPY
ncbi:MAG TPA: hypothetical protein VEL74_09835 [Thermoanaerobaculia bacterium]|nr:hypothetical protein [Thermoanaerobaculia bacterium]